MQTDLAQWALNTAEGLEAEEILRRCVHCGFCLATCPTYQILGDELDSPRGRIYLIKQMLEGEEVTASTQLHLDRCLTCRNCETTCPSGVEYGKLIDIGRKLVDERVQRPAGQRAGRVALRTLINSSLFSTALNLGRWFRPVLPAVLKDKVAASQPSGQAIPVNTAHNRQVLLLTGCVQPAMMPTIDAATLRVLDAIGIGVQMSGGSGCCGAVNFHLDAQDAALAQMRSNIDAWLPLLDNEQVEALVVNASGCGAMIMEYAHHLRHDEDYLPKALRLVNKVRDISEIIAPQAKQLKALMAPVEGQAAFHPPCTLQHWQGLRGLNETLLNDLGFSLKPFTDSHLCCGAAGTYSVTQPTLSRELKRRKLDALQAVQPDFIVSSNMGCITHLQSGAAVPVKHWIEIVDQALHAKTIV